MNRLLQKSQSTKQRKQRVRKSIQPKTPRLRLSVYVSNQHIIAQVIDDSTHKTVAYVTTANSKLNSASMTEKAKWVGENIAKKAKQQKIKQVVLDRGGKKYHGRIKALADEARKNGLEF